MKIHNPVSLDHNNICTMAVELQKVANDMFSQIMDAVFKVRDTPYYNLWHTSQFSADPIHSVYNGNELASYLESKILGQILAEIKSKKSFDGFKKEIKIGNPLNYHVEFVRRFYLI